jgi:hypothetical protein
MWFGAYFLAVPRAVQLSRFTWHRLQIQGRSKIAIIGAWWRRAREREQLARYTRYELRDLPGNITDTARSERAKPFWEL